MESLKKKWTSTQYYKNLLRFHHIPFFYDIWDWYKSCFVLQFLYFILILVWTCIRKRIPMASKIKNIFKATQKQITTIFFDLDNTLIPTRKGDSKAISKVSENIKIVIFWRSGIVLFWLCNRKHLIEIIFGLNGKEFCMKI